MMPMPPRLARNGWEPREMWKIWLCSRLGRALGIGIADLVNALNLPMYVVGGGVSSAWEAFSPFIFEELRQRSMVYAATAPATLTDGHGASAQVEPGGPTKTIITRALLGS